MSHFSVPGMVEVPVGPGVVVIYRNSFNQDRIKPFKDFWVFRDRIAVKIVVQWNDVQLEGDSRLVALELYALEVMVAGIADLE